MTTKEEFDADCDREPTASQEPLGQRGMGEAYSNLRKMEIKENSEPSHDWEQDTCTKCGDKDYLSPDKYCSESKLKPSEPEEWDGIGYPNVGDMINFRTKSYKPDDFVKVEVRYVSDTVHVLRRVTDGLDTSVCTLDRNMDWFIKPIKSEAELLAEERLKKIQHLEDFLMNNSTLYNTSCMGIAALIIDEYRLTPK